MSSKYRILPDCLTDCVTDWDERQKRDELTAAFLEAYEEYLSFRVISDPMSILTMSAYESARRHLDAAWAALQAHIKEAGQ